MSRISDLARVSAMRCEFDEGWYRGQCQHMAPQGAFCRQHASEKCKGCGEPATYWCGHADSFACGTPRCDTCDCPYRGPQGSPGSHGWKWGRLEQNGMSPAEYAAYRASR